MGKGHMMIGVNGDFDELTKVIDHWTDDRSDLLNLQAVMQVHGGRLDKHGYPIYADEPSSIEVYGVTVEPVDE